MKIDIVFLIHLIPALLTLGLGIKIITGKKGTNTHKRLGRVWALLMLFTALSSFGITGGTLAVYQGYSYLHVLSVLVLIGVPLGWWAARHNLTRLHQITMVSLFVSLCVTGALAVFMPARVLHDLLVP